MMQKPGLRQKVMKENWVSSIGISFGEYLVQNGRESRAE